MSKNLANLSKLKITDIKIYKLDIPRKDVFQIATMSLDKTENVLIEIQTNQDITGWGEASPFHALTGETQDINLAAAKELKELLIGKNPLNIFSLVKLMDEYLPHNTTIKSSFDMAFYDIAAKVSGLPLYSFLGGENRQLKTDFTLSIGSQEEAKEKVAEVQSMGYNMVKVKVGINDREDFLRLKNIREALGPTPSIRIDANQGWDRIQAAKNLEAFEQFDIEFCEQPCRATDFQGMKYVSHHSKIPVMADESLFSVYDALQLINENAVPYFNIKLSKSGGILNALKIAHVAEAGGIRCMIGCMSESRLALTAASHLATASKVFQFFDLDSFVEHAENPMIGGVTIENGFINLPDEPGLGVYPDPEYLKNLKEVK